MITIEKEKVMLLKASSDLQLAIICSIIYLLDKCYKSPFLARYSQSNDILLLLEYYSPYLKQKAAKLNKLAMSDEQLN